MAAAPKSFFAFQGEQFRKAEALEKIDDTELTPEEPYKSKYAARKIYEEILANLKAEEEKAAEDAAVAVEGAVAAAAITTEDGPPLDTERLLACRMATLLHLGINAYETEEVSDGERHLRQCLSLVGDFKEKLMHPKFVTHYIHACNHTGIVWNLRKDFEKSLEYFTLAKKVFVEYTCSKNDDEESGWQAPDALTTCFNDEEFETQSRTGSDRDVLDPKLRQEFESLHTHTLYFLAQSYERLGEKEKSAACCHETLWRQLQKENTELDVCDWSRNAAILSQYYVGTGEMKTARHCLAAATVMFGKMEFKTEEEDKEEQRDRTGAEIKRCWSAFALSLLRYSREADAKENHGDRDPDVDDELLERLYLNAAAVDVASGGRLSFLRDGRLDAAKVADQEEKIGCELAPNFDEARTVFLFGTNCLEDAKSYFSKDSHCSDYVSILQSHSQFYKMLADFEPDVARKCKMHKRRIDMLAEILKELNSTYYLMVMRQLRFELGEAYSTMMDLKYASVESATASGDAGPNTVAKPKPQVIAKINSLTKSAVDHFQDFIRSFHQKTPDGESRLPDTFEDMNVRPVLCAFFHVARLYTKFVDPDPKRRVVNMEVARGFYKKLVDYVEAHPEAKDAVEQEYEISKELVPMMEIKIKSIKSSVVR